MGVDALLFAFNIWKARWVPFHFQGSRGLVNRYYFQILEERILAYVNCQVSFVLTVEQQCICALLLWSLYSPCTYAVCSIAKILHSLFMLHVVSYLLRWIAVGCFMFLPFGLVILLTEAYNQSMPFHSVGWLTTLSMAIKTSSAYRSFFHVGVLQTEHFSFGLCIKNASFWISGSLISCFWNRFRS
jgi:hypothetical protein